MSIKMIGENSLKVNAAVLIFLFCIILASCRQSNLCQTIEVERKSSSDNRVDVVLVKSNCGATTSESITLYLVPSGNEINDQYSTIVMDRIDNLTVEWRDNKELEVHFSHGRIFSFTNFWQSSELDEYKYIVNINLMRNI